ncbi:MAG TPA: GNAT family N-acetyltransferase [Chthonomonadaceae bacterium]|nr:GNAT family N-acetyltransferase [Chthonomonadaceae bacterium]
MRVRQANLSDVAAMARVGVDSFLAAHKGQIPEPVYQWRKEQWTYAESAQGWERLLHEIADGTNPYACVYVAEGESAEIIGLGMAELAASDATGTIGEVYVLYVHPAYQRQGAGRRLVEAIARHLSERGITRLHIKVLKANTPARRFYEALGGQVIGECEVEEEGILLPEVVYGWSDIGVLVSD